MPPEDDQQHSVNDISHLFLSNVRSLAGQGMPRPQRKPPGSHSEVGASPAGTAVPQQAVPGLQAQSITPAKALVPSIDLTPEEYAHVFGPGRRPALSAEAVSEPNSPAQNATEPMHAGSYASTGDVAPVTALLAAHLGMRQLERARDYARHVAASGQRVGLIDLDVSEFRLYLIDPAVEPGVEVLPRQNATKGQCDPREIAEAIEELNVDVDRWFLLLPNVRTPEAKALLRDCESWTLLTTCDHDGVVSAYRTLKGVSDARLDDPTNSTRLGLTTLDAAGDAEAARVQQKLAGVCRQFLNWDIEPETPVRYAAGVAEHPLMNCRVTRDKAHLASAPHWMVVADMLTRPRRGAARHPTIKEETKAESVTTQPYGAVDASQDDSQTAASRTEPQIRRVENVEAPVSLTPATPVSTRIPAKPEVASEPMDFTMPNLSIAGSIQTTVTDEVIELPGEVADATGILSAVLRRQELGLVECPVAVPACPAGRLVVTRDRGLALVAAASRGMSELRAIGKAFQWMIENRSLIAMAMPQFAIDPLKSPSVILLVDQADITGELLRPMMQADHVTVRAYRTLRWAGRTGLLLEAA